MHVLSLLIKNIWQRLDTRLSASNITMEKARRKGNIITTMHVCRIADWKNSLLGDIMVGKKDDQIVMDCGCCDDGMNTDVHGETVKLKKHQATYCSAPICTSRDVNWQPCDVENVIKKRVQAIIDFSSFPWQRS